VGTFAVVWLVEFKHWETVRQLIYFLSKSLAKRSLSSPEMLGSNDTNLAERLNYRHEKYSARKWAVLVCFTLVVILRSITEYLVQSYYEDEHKISNTAFLAIISVLDTCITFFYLLTICLVSRPISQMRKFLQAVTVEGMNMRAACLHLVLVLIFFVSLLVNMAINYSVVAICIVREDLKPIDYMKWLLVGYLIKAVGMFAGCITLLYMFWRYTLLQELVKQSDQSPMLQSQEQKETQESHSPIQASKVASEMEPRESIAG